MLREIDLVFIKLHILYHASIEEVYGLGLIKELGRHGYILSPGTLYPNLAKMEKGDLLMFETITVNHKQRKYYHITSAGLKRLDNARRKIRELYKEIVENK